MMHVIYKGRRGLGQLMGLIWMIEFGDGSVEYHHIDVVEVVVVSVLEEIIQRYETEVSMSEADTNELEVA